MLNIEYALLCYFFFFYIYKFNIHNKSFVEKFGKEKLFSGIRTIYLFVILYKCLFTQIKTFFRELDTLMIKLVYTYTI